MKAKISQIEKNDDVQLLPGEKILSPEELNEKLHKSARHRKLLVDATERENMAEFDKAFSRYAKGRNWEENELNLDENPPDEFEDDEMMEKLLRDETPEFYEMNPADSREISPRAEKINVAIFA